MSLKPIYERTGQLKVVLAMFSPVLANVSRTMQLSGIPLEYKKLTQKERDSFTYPFPNLSYKILPYITMVYAAPGVPKTQRQSETPKL